MEIFNNDNYKFISDYVEQKLPILKENQNFKAEYLRLTDAMEELEQTLSKQQKEQFDEIVQLFYKTEEYYFAFSYSLGVKYGEDLTDDGQNPCAQNAPEDIAAHLFDHQDACKENPNHSDEDRNADGVECTRCHRLLKGKKRNLGSRIGDDDLGVQKPDKGDEQADAGGDGFFQRHRNGIEDGFADVRKG